MSIARSSYVRCDACGDPGPTVVEGAKEARRAARGAGFRRVKGVGDVCSHCLPRLKREGLSSS